MNLHRIRTIVLYSWFHLNHSMETWVDLLWMPIMEVLVFGFLSFFLQSSTQEIAVVILFGVLIWEALKVVQYSLSVGMMWDVWSRSFSSLFVSPLRMQEFLAGQAIAGMLKATGVLIFLSIPVYFLIDTTLLQLGWSLIPYLALLFTFAIALGMITNALILRFGTSIQSLAWSLVYLWWPISAVLYPVAVLPKFLQPVAYVSPITYVMEAIRYQLSTGVTMWSYLGQAALLTAVYFILATLFFRFMYRWSLRTGAFARMEN